MPFFFVNFRFFQTQILQKKLLASVVYKLGSSEYKANMLTTTKAKTASFEKHSYYDTVGIVVTSNIRDPWFEKGKEVENGNL